jgi:hypothetical protein
MTKLERECLQIAEREASKLGASIMWAHTGKHSELKVIVGDKSRKIALACTPRSDNQVHWVAQNVRRLVREINF